jgi:DNA helicase-2/ATP-dependent DNA helicase PcrA
MVIAAQAAGRRAYSLQDVHLIQMGVPAYRILALTFTNKAAAAMKERIVDIVGEKSRQLWMGTFHSVFARILRTECAALGYNRNFTIYDTADTLGVIKSIMNARDIPQQRFNPQAIRSRISGAKNQMIRAAEFGKQALDLFAEKAFIVYADYEAKLKASNAMDFDDLLLLPIDLLRSNKNILEKYQDFFRFILVDEYQDTNRTQYVLINMLAEKYRNVCVVGDDAQSIYAFRGADIRNILDFQRDYPDVKMIRLEQNYRSSRSILAAADQLIKHNVDQIAKDLWTENPEGELITHLTCEETATRGNASSQNL